MLVILCFWLTLSTLVLLIFFFRRIWLLVFYWACFILIFIILFLFAVLNILFVVIHHTNATILTILLSFLPDFSWECLHFLAIFLYWFNLKKLFRFSVCLLYFSFGWRYARLKLIIIYLIIDSEPIGDCKQLHIADSSA